jgi:hypothetical protein
MPFELGLALGWLQTSKHAITLVRNVDQPTVGQMFGVYNRIKIASPLVMKNAGAKTLRQLALTS